MRSLSVVIALLACVFATSAATSASRTAPAATPAAPAAPAAPTPPPPAAPDPGLPVMGSLDRITGFRATDVAAQREREARAAASVSPESLRAAARVLTAVPHRAGTPADSATAEYVRARFVAYGWDARIERVPVWLDEPRTISLTLLSPDSMALAVRERGLPGGDPARVEQVGDAFHGYGGNGDVTGPVVYANYGDVDDFKALATRGIDVHGAIVLVRYGKIFRGLKVRNAERAGAAGVLVFSDPADDGYGKADPFPVGAGRPEDAIQRGSVQYLSEGPGDPGTPGWPSTPGGRRLKPADMKGLPRIPSLPISYGEAGKILSRLRGPQSPSAWQGGLPFTYHLGAGDVRVRLVVRTNAGVRPIWNVIATLRGRESPKQLVIAGNHRDAWTYGAIDPNSGTICLLEMARAIGELAKTGWRPRRTLMLASWDGEEYGLLGSTEWCEANAAELGANAVAYLNVDVAVAGKDFRASASPALTDVIAEALREVNDPAQKRPLWRSVIERAWSEGRADWARRSRERRWRGEGTRPFEWTPGPLGSGSDYTAFLDHLGIPCADLRFEGLQGAYHSMYDDFDYLDRIVDPGYPLHVAMTDVWQRVALRLAEAELLPLRYSRTGTWALDELQAIDERADDAAAGRADTLRFAATIAPVREAAARLRNAGLTLERSADAALAGGEWPAGGVAAVNAALMGAERALLGPGLPTREWFRHELIAPGLDTGYAAMPLPRLGQAVKDLDPRAFARGIAPTRDALERAAAVLGGAR